MRNVDRKRVEIPISNATFIGSKETDVFNEIIDDFKHAKTVRVLTYSNIKSQYNQVLYGALQFLRKDVDLKIILGIPGLFQKKDEEGELTNTYDEAKIRQNLKKIREDFNKWILPSDTLNLCFNNHAKIIGTENIAYIGSSNYTEASSHNYEAGVIIRDKDVIARIYSEFVDSIQTARFKDDAADPFRINILRLFYDVDDLLTALYDFPYSFAQRGEVAYLIQTKQEQVIHWLDDLSDILEEAEEAESNSLDDLSDILEEAESSSLEDSGDTVEEVDLQSRKKLLEIVKVIKDPIHELIDTPYVVDFAETMFDSAYERSEEFFACEYEEDHKKRFKVNSPDSYVDEDTPYTPLIDEEWREDHLSEYWRADIEGKESYKEACRTIKELQEKIRKIQITLNEYVFDNTFTEEVVRQGSNDDVKK